MSEQFISAITDEAMSRVCFTGGWNLKPWMFFISQTDILEQFSEEEIFNPDGTVKEEIFTYLKQFTTEKMDNDYTSGNIWYNAQFSSLSKANPTTLTHHINIPGDIAIDTPSKDIKTIYFVYQDNTGNQFLYAIARSNGTLIFEKGVSQSFFFNFTVTNAKTQDMTEFILNYSCAHEIEDHNTTFGPHTHSNLVARDGSRDLDGILEYRGINLQDFNKPKQLVSKEYVDKYLDLIKDTILPLINDTICSPGTLNYWPGTENTVPKGWAVRNGQLLTIKDNPRLYALLGQRYASEARTQGYDRSIYFPLMNDSGLFIRSAEMDAGGRPINNNLLNGYAYGAKQDTAAPNVTGGLGAVNAAYWGAFYRNGGGHITLSTRNGSNWGSYGTFDASRSSNVYKNGAIEARPWNRNYLPIIRLG